ncbi:MAG: hypothetical protein WKF31_13070 [Thermoleophilaceae bacterium]
MRAHVLATAVTELYPGTKVSIGPPIDGGFYYDFDFPEGVRRLGRRLRPHRGPHARARQRPTRCFERTDVPVDEAPQRFREEQPTTRSS